MVRVDEAGQNNEVRGVDDAVGLRWEFVRRADRLDNAVAREKRATGEFATRIIERGQQRRIAYQKRGNTDLLMPSVTIADLNAAETARFVAVLGHIFEDSPWVAEGAASRRPFASVDALHRAMCMVVAEAPLEQRIALIAAHPDLVGRAALAGTLTPSSRAEQASAGLDRLEPEEIAMFTELNAAYRARFDFPFVICVRENKKASIIAGLQARVNNERPAEIATALGEIAKIARLRLTDLVRE
jgi:OHCU decarboxylase